VVVSESTSLLSSVFCTPRAPLDLSFKQHVRMNRLGPQRPRVAPAESGPGGKIFCECRLKELPKYTRTDIASSGSVCLKAWSMHAGRQLGR
jgi:hypothetical protein